MDPVEIPRPPRYMPPALELTKEQADKVLIARQLLEELWLEPEETGIMQKILPWIMIALNFVVLIIIIFKK